MGGRDGEGSGAAGFGGNDRGAELGKRWQEDRRHFDARGEGVGVGGRDGERSCPAGAARRDQEAELGTRREEDRGL
eukprot:709299-Hanusia_phi.AAC.1